MQRACVLTAESVSDGSRQCSAQRLLQNAMAVTGWVIEEFNAQVLRHRNNREFNTDGREKTSELEVVRGAF